MSQSLLGLAWHLTQKGEPFVLATVVWCERPTSAKPGAQALIQPDGRITGWIGGSCAQPLVIREAQRVLREGDNPYLLRLGGAHATTEPQHQEEVRYFPMTCSSGGALDIYIEPHLPAPQMLLIGDSPILEALKQLVPVLNFSVISLEDTRVPQVQINERTYVLVASHGQYDEEVLAHVLRADAAYVGLVASKRRAETCRAYLRDVGLSEEQVARLKAPAGLDIGAITPEEIAASILGEVVQISRHKLPNHHSVQKSVEAESRSLLQVAHVPEPESATDPVCNMVVAIAGARHKSHYEGQNYYFCCPACKRLFEADPGAYLSLKV
jgi:xanthine dehydrogenase accessory factor